MRHPLQNLLLVFVLMIPLARITWADSQLLDRVVAVVNDEPITQSELDEYLRPLYDDLRQQYQGGQLMQQLNEMRKKLLNQLIEDKLVFQKAKEQKIEIDEAEIEQELAKVKSKFANETEMETTLTREGFSLTALRERVTRQLMVRRLHDMEVRSKVVVSPLDEEAYYKEHAGDYAARTRVRVRSMTIKKEEQAREKGIQDEAALKKMKELRDRILKAEDFAQLAKANSQDYQAAQGGLSEWIEPGSLIPAIDQVIFKLKPGEVSEVIETPMGYHVFRLEEKEEGKDRSFEEVRDEIHNRLFQEKAKERFQEWMEQLKRESYISVR